MPDADEVHSPPAPLATAGAGVTPTGETSAAAETPAKYLKKDEAVEANNGLKVAVPVVRD